MQTIQDAIRSRTPTCELNSRQVNVDFNAAIFITLNPVGRGYGGRQRLPDNLKQLFRPVVMSKPNSEEIAETLLFAEGFKKAKEMAKKIVTSFEMSRWVVVRLSTAVCPLAEIFFPISSTTIGVCVQ